MIQTKSIAGAMAVMILGLAMAGLAQAAGPSGVVNVNTATMAELESLPGVGESRARAIIAEREERGGFAAIDELVEVRGIGDGLLRKLRPFVTVEGETTALVE